MVYEYSTRRVYSSVPRPVISTSYSYSLVPLPQEVIYNGKNHSPNYQYYILVPGIPAPHPPVGPIPVVTKLRQHPHLVLTYSPGSNKGFVINPLAIPRIANKRIVAVSPPPRRVVNGQNYYDLLESNVTGGFGNNRIVLVKYRPSPPPVPQTKVVYIEDVTDPSSTRLLRRELSPSPAPSLVYGSPWDISTPAGYVPCIPRPMFSVHSIPLRSASEVKEVADLRRMYVRAHNPDVGYSPLNKALLYRQPLPCYVDPTIPQNYYIGRGNLACLSFAGGRPISKRRRFYPDYEDKVRDEVVFRSFYQNLRDAAIMGRGGGKRPIYQPIYYSKKTILGEENVPKREPKESKWVERALANDKPPTPRPNKKSAPAPEPVAKEIVVAPPRKESLKMEVAPRHYSQEITLPGPRKSITEIIPDHVPKVENLPEEQVTIPAPPPKELTPPPPKEPTPPPKEPTPPPPKEPTPPPPKEPTPPPKEPTPPPPKEPTPPPPKEPTPPPKEPTPPPPKEPTPPPPKEPTPPPAKEPTPPPPKEPTPPPPVAEEAPAAPSEPAPESGSVSEVSAPAAAASEQGTGDEASNKGEVEELDDEEINSLDDVCDVEENDLEIESDDPETSQSAAPIPQETAGSCEPKVETEPAAASPAVEPSSEASTETPATQEPANNQDDAESPAPVSIVIRDIDGPLPDAEEPEEPLTVEQIQAEAERRREEFAQLLEEHAELVTTVTKLERVAVIVSKSCAEAIAQQENEQQPPKTTS